MFKILSICGSGVATSTLVSERLKEGLEEQGITDLAIEEANVNEAAGMIQNNRPDAVVSTTPLDSVELDGVRDFSGLPILMNINTQVLYKEIAEYLREK